MRKLKKMTEQGIIPKYLADVETPMCSACLYAKATRKKWRQKKRKKWKANKPRQKAGELVSVNQLVSPTPGLVAQITGILTTKRYKYATVYVDHFSGLSYVYLQKTASAKETIESKKAFEAYCNQLGVTVKAYHADNGIFRANNWVAECRANRQTLMFAGVNAHHTNGIAERKIRSLQELAQAMMIHANKQSPTYGHMLYAWLMT